MSGNTDPVTQYLDATGAKLDLADRARANKLPATLTHGDLIELILYSSNAKDDAWWYVEREIEQACKVQQLKAVSHSTHTIVPPEGVLRRFVQTTDKDTWIIHRDDARRYFQTVQWTPEEGSPLWCWLRGTSEQKKGKLKPEQQDKADFQQLCMEHWQVSPATLIRGDQGIVTLIGTSYLRAYKRDTLVDWASEVAPPEVKARRGRPRKTPVDQ